MNAPVLASGFADPVRDSQATFRAVMDALARPGTIQRLRSRLSPPEPLPPAAAALALTLCDFETSVWLGPSLAGREAVTAFLRFHTGASLVTDPAVAAFAFLARQDVLPPLDRFSPGTAEYPDRSTTVVLSVDALDGDADAGWILSGPGIEGSRRLRIEGLPADMPERLAANRSLFPRGVDLVLVAGDALAALPRSTTVTA